MNRPRRVPFAASLRQSLQREHHEPKDPLRSPFELDRHRILECTAFRRLEGKTQVFLAGHHDHFRTRLTHTLEVAQIARCLARGIHADEDLVEAIALAHDLGHPPFGHAGEAALNESLAAIGGFNHNAHSLRVVEFLEHPYPAFHGLNLTGATRAGLTDHSTRYDIPGRRAETSPQGNVEPPCAIECTDLSELTAVARSETASKKRNARDKNDPGRPFVESQIASMADRIAYNCHDLEDAIGAELICEADLAEVKLWRQASEDSRKRFGDKPIHAVRRVILDAILNRLLTDAVESSFGLVSTVASFDGVTDRETAVAFSSGAEVLISELEAYLLERVYQHPKVIETDAHGRRMVLELVLAYRSNPKALPSRFLARVDEQGLGRVIGDYIAGMTDRFCQREHERVLH